MSLIVSCAKKYLGSFLFLFKINIFNSVYASLGFCCFKFGFKIRRNRKKTKNQVNLNNRPLKESRTMNKTTELPPLWLIDLALFLIRYQGTRVNISKNLIVITQFKFLFSNPHIWCKLQSEVRHLWYFKIWFLLDKMTQGWNIEGVCY